MRKRDITFILMMLIGAAIVAFMPESIKVDKEVMPRQLIDAATHGDKYISTDQLAKLKMLSDPSIILVDVRSSDEYTKYFLPGAMNINLKDILSEDNVELLGNDVYTFVLYSNGSLQSTKAWLLLRRIGLSNIKVLKGGLNEWVETILQPKPLTYMATPTLTAQYEFRKSASRYFGLASADGGASSAAVSAPAAPIVKRKKKAAGGGGCD